MEGGYNPAVGEGVWLRIKRSSWGHSHLLRPAPSAVSTGACLGLVVQTPLSRFAQMCLCGNTALERSSDLCSNRSRDLSALLVTRFCNVFLNKLSRHGKPVFIFMFRIHLL